MAVVKTSDEMTLVDPSATDSSRYIAEKREILDEDVYVEKLEKIIERDFFPDIAKLKAQAEYLEAVEKNDVEKIRQLQMKYSRRRTDQIRQSRTPRHDASPETFETPTLKRKRPDTDLESTETEREPVHVEAEPKSVDTVESLDNFLAKFTSEDNESYGEIIELAERKRRQKLAWMYSAEKEHNRKLALAYEPYKSSEADSDILALPSAGEETVVNSNSCGQLVPITKSNSTATAVVSSVPGDNSRPATVDGWSYKAINSVMWVPEEVALTPEEKLKRKLLSEREILHKNTRFTENPFSKTAADDTMNRALGLHAAVNKGRVDVQGCEVGGLKRPGTQFSYVVTPSPMPGVNESPMMTWGEIEGTPFRLDASDMPIVPGTGAGPSFKMPDVPVRDTVAINLAEEASKRYRQRKEKAVQQVTHNFASPSAKFGSAKSIERLKEMSPAARRLATSKLGIRLSTDRALKASYTPSPLRLRGEKTPILASATPSALKTPEARTPKSKRPVQPESLTDNLLKISSDASSRKPETVSDKRARAEDFFD